MTSQILIERPHPGLGEYALSCVWLFLKVTVKFYQFVLNQHIAVCNVTGDYNLQKIGFLMSKHATILMEEEKIIFKIFKVCLKAMIEATAFCEILLYTFIVNLKLTEIFNSSINIQLSLYKF